MTVTSVTSTNDWLWSDPAWAVQWRNWLWSTAETTVLWYGWKQTKCFAIDSKQNCKIEGNFDERDWNVVVRDFVLAFLADEKRVRVYGACLWGRTSAFLPFLLQTHSSTWVSWFDIYIAFDVCFMICKECWLWVLLRRFPDQRWKTCAITCTTCSDHWSFISITLKPWQSYAAYWRSRWLRNMSTTTVSHRLQH